MRPSILKIQSQEFEIQEIRNGVQLLAGAGLFVPVLPTFDGLARNATNSSSSSGDSCGNAGIGGAPCVTLFFTCSTPSRCTTPISEGNVGGWPVSCGVWQTWQFFW